MISKLNGEITLCQMGEGTLFAGVVKNAKEQPVGITFSNDQQSLKDSIVFQINSIEGVAGYLLPLVALIEEWEKQGFVETANENKHAEFSDAIRSLRELLEPFQPKVKE